MTGRTDMTGILERVRSLRTAAAPVPSWQVPPTTRVVRDDVVVALAGSERLRAGLASQWRQRTVLPTAPGTALRGAHLLLVELADGRVPTVGVPGGPEVDALVAAARQADVPIVVWITAGRPPSGRAGSAAVRSLLAAAAEVHVADLLETWQELAPQAGSLPPAAPAQRQPGTLRRDAVPTAVVVAPGASDPVAAGPVGALLGPGLRPIEDRVEALLTDPDLPAAGILPRPLADRSRTVGHAEVAAALARARVVVDGPRRTPVDTWTVVEAAAAGAPVVSVTGLALPEGLEAVTPASPESLRAEVVARLHHDELADREALRQRRAVLARHTWDHRARVLLGAIDRQEPDPAPPTVSAIVPTNRLHEVERVLDNIARQAHPGVELVLVLHGVDVAEAELQAQARDRGVERLVVVRAPGHLTLGACLNLGIDVADGDLVAKMDDDNFYGTHYLSDLVAALRAQGAGIAGKWAHYVWLRSSGAVVLRYPDAEDTWARRIQGGSMLFAGDVARGLRFGDLPRAVDSDILDRAIAAGVPIWSADRFNFVSVRGEDRTSHTWTAEDATFLTASGRLSFYGDPRDHVEV